MKRLVALFLSWTLLEARSLSSKSQLHNFLLIIVACSFAANLNYALHVAPFSTNKATSYLEFFVIVNLNIEPAGVFNIIIIIIVVCALDIISTLYSRRHRQLLIAVKVYTICLGTPTYLLGRLK
jgi:hypothetical protein